MEKQVANIILGQSGPAETFTLKYGFLKFNLSIKPITAKQLIEISGELSQIKTIDPAKEMFPEMIERTSDLKYICNSIAIATGTKFRRIVTFGLMDLEIKDILTLFQILKKQSDPELFFYTLVTAKGLNRITAKQEEQ